MFSSDDGRTLTRSFLIRPVADSLAAIADPRIPKEGDRLSDKQADWRCVGHSAEPIRPDYFDVRAIYQRTAPHD